MPSSCLAALLLVAGGAAAAPSSAEPRACAGGGCLDEDGSDELGLLQKAQRESVAPEGEPLDCLHGGWVSGGHCNCVPGWWGRTCDRPLETKNEWPGKSARRVPGSQEVCGQYFVTYPYNNEPLWGTAYLGWEDCAGSYQSPIDISTKAHNLQKKSDTGALDVNYGIRDQSILVNNGHALEVQNSQFKFGSLTIAGTTYRALGAHWHSPSEHTVDGEAAPLEMHIVHASRDGDLAVVGIFFDLGAENECLKPLPLSEAPKAGCSNEFGMWDLSCFKEQLSGPWWSYNGSLTTPGCSEGVAWNVMKNRATISKEQLQGFQSRHINNARAVQTNLGSVTLNTP